MIILTVTASADQTKLSGTVELDLPDGKRFLPLDGKYKPKSDKGDIEAKGSKDNKGMEVELKGLQSTDGGTFERGTASFDVQGITGKKSLKAKRD